MPPQVSGRSVRIVPLTFYKVFSHWGSGRYEHIFATDEPFEVLNLLSYWSSTSIKQQPACDHIGSVLIPISVRRVGRMDGKTLDRTKHDPNSLIPASTFVVPTASTFLFSKSIDFLIRNYRDNRPLAQVNNLERYTHQDTLHGMEVPMAYTHAGDNMLSGGVRSYGDYQKFIFDIERCSCSDPPVFGPAFSYARFFAPPFRHYRDERDEWFRETMERRRA